MMPTSGAVPEWIALRMSVSSLLGTLVTVIHGYLASNDFTAASMALISGFEKNDHSVSVTGAWDALGLTVGVEDGGVTVLPPAVQAAPRIPRTARAATIERGRCISTDLLSMS